MMSIARCVSTDENSMAILVRGCLVLGLLFGLGLEPVGKGGGTGGSLGRGVLALDIDGEVLVLLEVAGEVGLFGGLGRLGEGEGLDLAD